MWVNYQMGDTFPRPVVFSVKCPVKKGVTTNYNDVTQKPKTKSQHKTRKDFGIVERSEEPFETFIENPSSPFFPRYKPKHLFVDSFGYLFMYCVSFLGRWRTNVGHSTVHSDLGFLSQSLCRPM